MKASCHPQVLQLNRVKRLYLGGKNLDRWQGLNEREDSGESEEFLISTVPYIGPGTPKYRGISVAEWEGEKKSLDEMIREDEQAFLGKGYEGLTGGHLGILTRVGDSAQRLILQCHPDGAFARAHLGVPFGKTEAWYIADTRKEEGYCYACLKKGMTRQGFRKAFLSGNSEAMLEMLHRIPFRRGDMLLIPSGILHAMGPGVTFIEFHEPCDYTLRFESDYLGQSISQEELHSGLGVELLMDAVDFTTYTYEEAEKLVRQRSRLLRDSGGISVEELLSYERNPYFKVDRAVIQDSVTFCQSLDSHCIMITAKGSLTLKSGESERQIPQGRGIVIPACAGEFTLAGDGAEVLVGYPFQMKKGVSYGLFI